MIFGSWVCFCVFASCALWEMIYSKKKLTLLNPHLLFYASTSSISVCCDHQQQFLTGELFRNVHYLGPIFGYVSHVLVYQVIWYDGYAENKKGCMHSEYAYKHAVHHACQGLPGQDKTTRDKLKPRPDNQTQDHTARTEHNKLRQDRMEQEKKTRTGITTTMVIKRRN